MSVKREFYQERVRLGLCPTCGGQRDRHTIQCGGCVQKSAGYKKKYHAKRKIRGICRSCPAEVQGTTYCPKCQEAADGYAKTRYFTRKARGMCLWCETPRAVGRFCPACWFDGIALRVMGSKKHGAALRSLFDAQNGRCFYTNETLVPGKNAALDHQTPKSAGGEDRVENFRWTTIQVNRVKSDLTHEAFVALCRSIAARF